MFSMLCMMGAVAFLASSCNKNDQKSSVSIGLPAAFQEVSADDEKLYVDFNDGNVFKWNAEDEVMIYNLNENDGTQTVKAIYTAGTGAEGQVLANFDGDDLGNPQGHYFVFFPVNKVEGATDALDANNYQTFRVFDTQEYTLVNGNPTVDKKSLAAACEVNSMNEPFTLNHIFGVCRLRLKGDKTVTRIELTDEHHGLAGTVGMKLHEVNMAKFQDLMDKYTLATDLQSGMNPAFVSAWNTYRQELGYTSNAESHTIALTFTNGGVQLNSDYTPFYITVRPGAFIDGFKVKVYYDDNTDKTFEKYNHPKTSYRIRAGYVTSFKIDVNTEN
jgi:hypothetical protein